MYTLVDPPKNFEQHDLAAKETAARLCALLQPLESNLVVAANTDLLNDDNSSRFFYLIKEGQLECRINKKIPFYYHEGDLIGLEKPYNLSENLSNAEINANSVFAIVVDKFSIDHIFSEVQSSSLALQQLVHYLSIQNRIFSLLAAHYLQGEVLLDPEFRHFETDQVIIQQGTPADFVYTLVEGSAEAFVDGVKVGEIKKDEIFGMLAVLTNTPRTATVKTTKKSMAIAVHQSQFTELIQSKPQTVLKLIEDMSKTIVSLNEKIIRYNYSVA